MTGLHDYHLNPETRRMTCSRCGGVMNECGATCPGRVKDFELKAEKENR